MAQYDAKPRESCQRSHRRYYRIADITIRVDADLPITEHTFHPKFERFLVDGPGEDTIAIWHHFSLPELCGRDLGREVYREPPWAIYRSADSWTYLGISPGEGKRLHRLGVFDLDHTRGSIYSPHGESFRRGHLQSITLFPTDQILLARVLADREGCYLHAAGVALEDQGLLFVGHSETGKSTMATMLRERAEILCDDRIIVRKRRDKFHIYGTWSHGDVPDVSAASAPLKAILFLEQAAENRLVPVTDKQEIARRLLGCLIKPLVTAEWWQKTLTLVEQLVHVPCYVQRFDQSGQIVNLIEYLP